MEADGSAAVLIKTVNVPYRLLYICSIVLLISACAESELDPDTDRLGLQYFPLEVGSYRIYDVVEKNYTVLGVTTDIYELKESVADSNVNAGNNLQYIIHRSTRANDTEQWKLDSVWTAQINTSYAVLVENNLPLMKLTFPIVHDSTWNGNALNSQSFDEYRFDTSLNDTIIAENEFQNLVGVIQQDRFEDILGLTEKSEIYAPDVGLLIKESTELRYCTEQDSNGNTILCDNIVQIEAGREITMTLKEYGKE